jgi:putative transposase
VVPCGQGTGTPLMQEHGIRARCKRKFVVTTDSKHHLPIAPDLVQRNFTAERTNQVWTGDITYIATDEGWLYLAAVIDLFSRQVVGWSMQPHMQSSLVTDALKMAWFRRHRHLDSSSIRTVAANTAGMNSRARSRATR